MPPSPRIRRNPSYTNPFQAVVDQILTDIFVKERCRLDKVLLEMIAANQVLGGTRDAFYLNGKLVSPIPLRHLRGREIKPLHPSLEAQGESYLALSSRLEADIRHIRNAISVVLYKCRHVQDARDVLSDSLVRGIPEFQGIERMREEGFMLRDNPTLLRQFRNALDLVTYYQANQLIYA